MILLPLNSTRSVTLLPDPTLFRSSGTACLLLTAAQRASISCPTGRENPMEHPDEIRRKRLRFQSWHRGTKESDLILGRFADRYLETFDAAELSAYERLLDYPDPEIFDWVSGRVPLPVELESPVTRLLMKFNVAEEKVD